MTAPVSPPPDEGVNDGVHTRNAGRGAALDREKPPPREDGDGHR
ncbi:hypothetical protein [Streptomyces thermolineatus]